ncbi:MAG: hypothetical protein IT208_03605 [Chthonomonadales bacterium]|nr:hypothetical protein [Chthonomonadales bacterium]
MQKNVNPVVAVLAIVVILGVVAFCYTFVFSGKITGQVGPPESVKGLPFTGGSPTPPPGGGMAMPPKDGPPKGGPATSSTRGPDAAEPAAPAKVAPK